ncbi:purple acid phosphatase family protein [Streptomyces beijiangensis]|uniref:Metallophosphoesterase family protein n=1 Tax=Streptomyces beijiangensis TaxID=163361 RepID=A0A939FG36_9ACTN|nr:metallophosphoesterase family protein [Streptomyces beijiangensis]MBO0516762.1 metallophosphoesterase family protein [Streptomyces beijiangensis]
MDIPRFGIPEKLADRMSMAEQHEYLRTKLSRRGALRTGLATAAVAGAGVTMSASTASAAPARLPSNSASHVDGSLVAPFGRHLAYGADPKSQMTVSWQVPFAVKRPYIRIGRTPWELSRKIDAEVRHLTTPSLNGGAIAAAEQYYVHAELNRLRPGTTYYYGVGHDGFDPANRQNLGSLGTFTTAPERAGSFTFTAFGDQGVSYHALGNDALILGQNPAFHLHAGDICYADPSGSGQAGDVYDARTWDQFLAQTESVSKTVPWMVTTGNHDMEAWYSPNGYGGQNARWTLPDNGPDPVNQPGVYSFVHGNVGVVALDANDVSYEIPANYGISGGKQTKWLDKRLGELRARRDIDFIVIFFHHCAFSTTNSHASDGGVREQWVPVFEKHEVDLVINGHNHVYERTDAVKGGAVGRTIPIGAKTDPTRDGIVYVTAGGAGRSLYDFPAPDSFEGHVKDQESVPTWHSVKGGGKAVETVEWSRVRYTGYSFLAVEVTAGHDARLKVSALAESGARIDHFEIKRGN